MLNNWLRRQRRIAYTGSGETHLTYGSAAYEFFRRRASFSWYTSFFR